MSPTAQGVIVLVVTTIAFWGFLRREFTAVR